MKTFRMLVVLIVTASALSVPQASAKVTVQPSLQAKFAACAARISAAGLNVIKDVQNNGKDNKIVAGETDLVLPIDPTALIIGGSSPGTQYWNPDGGALIEKGATEAENIYADGCASLVHEGHHLRAMNNGDLNNDDCLYTNSDGVQVNTKIPVKEVYAVYAENAYRFAAGLPVRHTYTGHDLPPNNASCEKKKDEPKPGRFGCSVGPVGASCAGSNGDPHLTTLDGFPYDLMAAGEFTLVQADSLRIQVRQTAFPGSRDVTLNTAVAADVAGDRVGVYLRDGVAELKVNSQPVDVGEMNLPNGGSVSPGDDGAVWIGWPDESLMEIRPIGRWGLSLTLRLDESHRDKVTGLLGNDNGDDSDDLVLRERKRLEGNSFSDLYPKFADSWRVSAEESLFDYLPGESTATFTDRSMPDAPIIADDLPHRETAELICRRAGVNEPAVLQGCILDVALTGQSVFATDAARTEQHTAAGDLTLTVDRDGEVARSTVTATAGQRLFVDAVRSTLPDECAVLQLFDPEGARIAAGCLIGGNGYIDGTVLPISGEYTVAVDPTGAATGQAALEMHLSTDESQRVTADGLPATATIGTPGAVSFSIFDGRAGQKVYVDASGATIADQCAVLQLLGPDGARIGAGCLIGGRGSIDATVLPADGRYRIVVDPAGRDTGSTQLRLITSVDQVASVRVGGSAATAIIAQPGAVSRLYFDGTAGQRVSIDASGWTLPGQCGLLELRDAADEVLSRGCVLGGSGGIETLALPADGRYTVVVDPVEDGVGEVQIAVRGLKTTTQLSVHLAQQP